MIVDSDIEESEDIMPSEPNDYSQWISQPNGVQQPLDAQEKMSRTSQHHGLNSK